MFLIGNSIDYHKLVEKRNSTIKLGGVPIKVNYQIVAHSDGDLILHAIANAVLGAKSKEDIGTYFPDTKKSNKNINSIKILKKALSFLNKNEYINNIDLTIICDKIFLKNHIKKIKNNLINLLKCTRIAIKATRFEENKNLISCYCSLLINN